jgi:hypothetical protein
MDAGPGCAVPSHVRMEARHPLGDPGRVSMMNPETPSDQSSHARVRHTVTLRFDDLGWQTIGSAASDYGQPLEDFLATALAYFEDELPAERTAVLAPRFKPVDHGRPRELLLALEPQRWQRMEDEALRQGVPLAQLCEHAALLFLADLDSGRVADRLLGEAEQADDGEHSEGRP